VAYDEELAARIRDRLRDVSEKTMFGGRVFLVDGNIAVGAYSDDLLVRVHPDEIPGLLAKQEARPFLMGGRATRGFVLVSGGGLDDAALERWIGVARAYLAAQPTGTGRRRGRTAH
jgi:TfoX N-terminal domain